MYIVCSGYSDMKSVWLHIRKVVVMNAMVARNKYITENSSSINLLTTS